MTPGDAMIQEMSVTRTLVGDALANKCVQLAAEKFALEQRLQTLVEQVETQAQELTKLKEDKTHEAGNSN